MTTPDRTAAEITEPQTWADVERIGEIVQERNGCYLDCHDYPDCTCGRRDNA